MPSQSGPHPARVQYEAKKTFTKARTPGVGAVYTGSSTRAAAYALRYPTPVNGLVGTANKNPAANAYIQRTTNEVNPVRHIVDLLTTTDKTYLCSEKGSLNDYQIGATPEGG